MEADSTQMGEMVRKWRSFSRSLDQQGLSLGVSIGDDREGEEKKKRYKTMDALSTQQRNPRSRVDRSFSSHSTRLERGERFFTILDCMCLR